MKMNAKKISLIRGMSKKEYLAQFGNGNEGELRTHLQKLITILALPNMGEEGRKAKIIAIKIWQIEHLQVLDEFRKEFPTVEQALKCVREVMPRRNFEEITNRNRVLVQTAFLMLIEKWHIRWLGYEH